MNSVSAGAAGITRDPEPTRRTLKARRIEFDYPEDELRRHFMAGGDAMWSAIIAVLSALFPAGEDFFVRSVRNVRDQITDPALQAEVAGFIGQEATHGNEHRHFNERLSKLGYPTATLDRWLDRDARFATDTFPQNVQLAMTAAFEHYTAMLAELLLTDSDARALFGEGEVLSMFLWHALEESEHKAVAFDVYRAVGGTELMRIVTMQVVTVGFVAEVVVWTLISLASDPAARRPRGIWDGICSVVRSPFISMRALRMLIAYSRPGFHPNERDATALVEEWRSRLFGEDGALTPKLKRPSAA